MYIHDLRSWVPLFLVVASTTCTIGAEPKAPMAKGEVVPELGKSVMSVFQTKDNSYWFASFDRGAYRYDGKTLVNFTMKDGLVSNCIRGIQEDKSGNVYFTSYEGIGKYDGQAFTTLKVPEDAPAVGWKKDPDDLWFPGPPNTGGVFRYDGKTLHNLVLPKCKYGEDYLAKNPPEKFPNVKQLPYDVYTITKDRKGNVWFGTAIAGVCRYDGKSFDWLYEKHLTETNTGGSFGIRSVFEDKAGVFWICNTRHRYHIDPKDAPTPQKGFMKYRREKGIEGLKDRDGANHVYFFSMVEDAKGTLWMATYTSGVWSFDGSKPTRYPVKDGTKEITLASIYKDNQGNLWLGTHESGAYRFDGKGFEKFRP